jgi:hypothetical protein
MNEKKITGGTDNIVCSCQPGDSGPGARCRAAKDVDREPLVSGFGAVARERLKESGMALFALGKVLRVRVLRTSAETRRCFCFIALITLMLLATVPLFADSTRIVRRWGSHRVAHPTGQENSGHRGRGKLPYPSAI